MLLGYHELHTKEEYVGELKQSIADKEQVDLVNLRSIKFLFQNLISDETDDLAELIRCYPDTKFVYFFFQLADYKVIKELRKFLFVSVKTNHKIFFPRSSFQEILENASPYGFDLPMLKKDCNFDQFGKDFFKGLQINKPEEDKYQVRVLTNFKLDMNNILNLDTISNQIKEMHKNIIFHVHGGGYVALSTSSHQFYLRKYAKTTDSILFTIDYPKAPGYKFS